MKYILLLLLVGCAASTETLITEANECVKNYISPTGVMGKPTDEDTQECWSDVNSRIESETKRAAKREAERPLSCPLGYVLVCKTYSRTDKDCGCMRSSELRRIFEGRY